MFSDNASDSDERLPDPTFEHDAGSENLDSVPDFEQEHHGLDPQTQRILDSLEEEGSFIPENSSDIQSRIEDIQAQEPERLERLASAVKYINGSASEGVEAEQFLQTTDLRAYEMSDGVPDSLQEASTTSHGSELDDLLPEAYLYRVVATMPEIVENMIAEALSTINYSGPVYGLQIQAPFQTGEIHKVSHELHVWANEVLPLSSQLVSVHSEVWGSQHYMAGWRMNNASAWYAAHNELIRRLSGLIVPASSTSSSFRAFVGLIESVPVAQFPDLVAFLHRQFETVEFSVTSIQLVRKPLPRFERRVPVERRQWLTFRIFPLHLEG